MLNWLELLIAKCGWVRRKHFKTIMLERDQLEEDLAKLGSYVVEAIRKANVKK